MARKHARALSNLHREENISDELISRKQLFQMISMGYDIRSFIIGQLQSDGSI